MNVDFILVKCIKSLGLHFPALIKYNNDIKLFPNIHVAAIIIMPKTKSILYDTYVYMIHRGEKTQEN